MMRTRGRRLRERQNPWFITPPARTANEQLSLVYVYGNEITVLILPALLRIEPFPVLGFDLQVTKPVG